MATLKDPHGKEPNNTTEDPHGREPNITEEGHITSGNNSQTDTKELNMDTQTDKQETAQHQNGETDIVHSIDNAHFIDNTPVSVEVSGISVHTRDRKLTEKGLAYQIDVSTKKLRSALLKHKQSCGTYESVLESGVYSSANLIQATDAIELAVNDVSMTFHELGHWSLEVQNEFRLKFEETMGINRNLRSKLANALRVIEHVDANKQSNPDHHGAHSEHKSHSKHKSHSRLSRSSGSKGHSGSKGSSHSSKSRSSGNFKEVMKLEAAAKAAALKAKLEFHEAEVKHQSELQKLKLMRDIAVEEAKLYVISQHQPVSNVLSACREASEPLYALPKITSSSLPTALRRSVSSPLTVSRSECLVAASAPTLITAAYTAPIPQSTMAPSYIPYTASSLGFRPVTVPGSGVSMLTNERYIPTRPTTSSTGPLVNPYVNSF